MPRASVGLGHPFPTTSRTDLAALGELTVCNQVSLLRDSSWSEPLLLQREVAAMGAQHFPTRAVHDSLCPTDASQPEEARDKSIQIPSFPSDVPVPTNSPHHRSSEGAAMPLGSASDLPCSLSATGCGGITAWSLSCQEGDLRPWQGSPGEFEEEFGFRKRIPSFGDRASFQV